MSTGNESCCEEIKRYVRFTDADVQALAAFRARAAPHFPRIAAAFYERVREHENAHDAFADEAQIERLHVTLVQWMDRSCSGPFDDAHFEATRQVGAAHARVGLPQRYIVTGMNLMRIALAAVADAEMGDAAQATRDAITRALDLELAALLEAYADDRAARAERVERVERAEAARTQGVTHPYLHAAELAKVLIVGLDNYAVVRLFNREAERVTGRGRDEVIGTSFIESLLPLGLREEQGVIFESAAKGLSTPADMLESAVCTRAGRIRDVRWQLARPPSTADVALFAIGQDTTDTNLALQRLRQREKLAAVGTLAAGLAHEIRNPLNGAHLHLTFLERGLRRLGVTDVETVSAVKVVSDEISRLSVLASEFLEFARPHPIEPRAIGVTRLCARAIDAALAQGEPGDVKIRLDAPATDIIAELDEAKMEQAIVNLLVNAIEALGPDGGGHAVLRVRRRPRHLVIEVEDEGPGLPTPGAPVFDPFFSTKPRGTGLGLAIVHKVVTDHEGTVDVHSRPGQTIFRITLPLGLVC